MPKEKPQVNIGEVIRTYRSQRSLSQGDIERRTGLLRCYLSRVENGHTVPSLETLAKIAEAMDISLADFFPGTETPRDRENSKSAWRALARRNSLPGGDQKVQHHALGWRQAAGAGDDPQDGYPDSTACGEEVDCAPAYGIAWHAPQASKLLMSSKQKDDLSARKFPGILIVEMTGVQMTGVCCCPHPNGDGRRALFGLEASFLKALYSKIEANPPPGIPAGGFFVLGNVHDQRIGNAAPPAGNSNPTKRSRQWRPWPGGSITFKRWRPRVFTSFGKQRPNSRVR